MINPKIDISYHKGPEFEHIINSPVLQNITKFVYFDERSNLTPSYISYSMACFVD